MSSTSPADALDRLATAQPGWAEATSAERAVVAEEVLAELQRDDWSLVGCWVRQELALEGFRMDPTGRDKVYAAQGAVKRMIFGNVIKDFLEASITAAKGGTLPTARSDAAAGVRVHGPIAIGPAAPGVYGEVWCDVKAGTVEHSKKKKEKVTVVLGAGNQSFLSIVDVLECVFTQHECVLLKHHPLRPFLLAPYAAILKPLVARGLFAQVLDDGLVAASALLTSPLVGQVAMTGSEATFRAVRRTLDRAGRADVSVRAELGCVSPWIVAPGQWSDVELDRAAELIAAAKKTNAGSNCLAAQLLVISRDWEHKEAFVAKLKAALSSIPDVPNYYPGAPERLAKLRALYDQKGDGRCEEIVAPRAQQLGAGEVGGGERPYSHVALLMCGVAHRAPSYDPTFEGSALGEEAFCPALAMVELPSEKPPSEKPGGEGGGKAADYVMKVAIPFVNGQVTSPLAEGGGGSPHALALSRTPPATRPQGCMHA